MTAGPQPTPAPAPALVVFGRDEAGKPHASAFSEADAPLATKAAQLMGLSVLTVRTDDARALAGRVPKGRVFASGKAFVPFIKPALYLELQATSLKSGAANLKLVASSPSADEAEAKAGPASGDAETKAGPASGPAAATVTAARSPKTKLAPALRQPSGWADIGVGAIVLAAAPPGYRDWFECVVVAVHGEDQYALRYCDWPKEPPFTRRRVEVALLHPAYAPEPPLEPEVA